MVLQRMLSKDLVRGQYVTYLCDDDILYPDALAAFHRYIEDHAGTMAMYGSIDMTVITAKGQRLLLRESTARNQALLSRQAPSTGEVDYLQLCHHVDVLKTFPSDEYWPELRRHSPRRRHLYGTDRQSISHFPGVREDRGKPQGSTEPQLWRRQAESCPRRPVSQGREDSPPAPPVAWHGYISRPLSGGIRPGQVDRPVLGRMKRTLLHWGGRGQHGFALWVLRIFHAKRAAHQMRGDSGR